MEDQVKNAGSIFEFSAKDIDGNVVSFEKYRLGPCHFKFLADEALQISQLHIYRF